MAELRRTLPVHFPRLSISEVRTILGCTLRVLADSNRTEDIITSEELLAQRQLRYLIEQDALGGEGAVLNTRPEIADMPLGTLAAMPSGTLGYEVARFFSENGLSTEIYGLGGEHTPDPDSAYLLSRVRHAHDVWHVLMNFTTRGHDEILIHAFSLAQTGFPSSVGLILFGSMKHMVLEARWACVLRGVREAYRRGQQAEWLLSVRWEDHYHEPLEDVRAGYGIEPWSAADHASTEPWRWSRSTPPRS